MTPSLPRAPQIGSRQVGEALCKLAVEVGGLKAFEPGVREAIGNTNWTVLMQRLDEAVAALSRTAQAPVADGVREAAQILLSEIDSATDMDCVIAASSALRTALASSPAMLAAPKPSPTAPATGGVVEADELRRYIDRCRELSAQGEYAWWSRLADILAALSRSEPQAAPVSHGEAE